MAAVKEETQSKRATWPYMVLLVIAGVAALLYRPSVRSAEIDAPLTMPRFRNMEIAAAEWAVKRHLQQWDEMAFRNARIVRHEGRLSVCGEVVLSSGAPLRYVVNEGQVSTERDEMRDFEAIWEATCAA